MGEFKVGLKNGQPVVYEVGDPLSSYGVQPATITPTGQIVATGPAQYQEVPYPSGGVVTIVQPETKEAVALTEKAPTYGTVEIPPTPTAKEIIEKASVEELRGYATQGGEIGALAKEKLRMEEARIAGEEVVKHAVLLASKDISPVAVTPEEYRAGKLKEYGEELIPYTGIGLGKLLKREVTEEGEKLIYEPSILLTMPTGVMHPREIFKLTHPEVTELQLMEIEKQMEAPEFQFVFGAEKMLTESVPAVIGSIPALIGGSFERYQKELTRKWLREQYETMYKLGMGKREEVLWERGVPTVIAGALWTLPAGLSIGAKFIPKVLPHLPVSVLPYVSPTALKIAGVGIASGVLGYGTLQTREALPRALMGKYEAGLKFGTGVTMMGFGAYGVYAGWKSIFPPKVEQVQLDIAKQRTMIEEELKRGISESDITGFYRRGLKTGEIKATTETGFKYDIFGEKIKSEFLQATKIRYQVQKTGWEWLKAKIKGEPLFEWKEISLPSVGKAWTVPEGGEFKVFYEAGVAPDLEKLDIFYGVTRGKITTYWEGKPVEAMFKGISGEPADVKQFVPEIRLFEPSEISAGKIDITYKTVPKPVGIEIFKPSKPPSMIYDFSKMIAEQQKDLTKDVMPSIVGAQAKVGLDVTTKAMTNMLATTTKEVATIFPPLVIQPTITKEKPIVKEFQQLVTTKKAEAVLPIITPKLDVGLKPAEKTEEIPLLGITPITTTVVAEKQLEKQMVATTQITDVIVPITPITTTVTPPPPPPPPTPIPITFGLPSGGFRRFKMPSPLKKGKQKTRYQPSLGGVLGFAKPLRKAPKKIFTGIEIRGVVSRKGRKEKVKKIGFGGMKIKPFKLFSFKKKKKKRR